MTVVPPWLLGLVGGLLLGIVGVLLLPKLWEGGESVPRKLVDALDCPAPIKEPAAAAHHIDGYSWFAATHADEIAYAGCETGPGTTYLHFPFPKIRMSHVLASLHRLDAVCVVGNGVFDGTLLDGEAQLKELCGRVGGKLELLKGHGLSG